MFKKFKIIELKNNDFGYGYVIKNVLLGRDTYCLKQGKVNFKLPSTINVVCTCNVNLYVFLLEQCSSKLRQTHRANKLGL